LLQESETTRLIPPPPPKTRLSTFGARSGMDGDGTRNAFGDEDMFESTSDTATPAMVHVEQSSRGTIKHPGKHFLVSLRPLPFLAVFAFFFFPGTLGGNFVPLTDSDEITIDESSPPVLSRYGDFHTIDWQRDLARDRLRHKFIVKWSETPLGKLYGLWDAGSGWICVLMVGLAAGTVAGIIDIGARWMSDLKDGVCADRFWLDREHCCWSANDSVYKDADCSAWTSWPEMMHYYERNFFYYIMELFFYCGWSVLMTGLTVALVKASAPNHRLFFQTFLKNNCCVCYIIKSCFQVFAPYACGSGIPEIKCILSGFIIRGYLGKWTFIIKSVGLILASASGLNLGKEGPMVHLACCIGNIFSYLFPKYGSNEAKKREILSASAAAGVSVAFGAPIGGVLFRLFCCIFCQSLGLLFDLCPEAAAFPSQVHVISLLFFSCTIQFLKCDCVKFQTSLFHVDYSMKWTFIELIPFAGLGLFGGIIGSVFIWANIKWCRFRKANKTLGNNPVKEVLIITLITAFVSYFNPYTRRSASSLIRQLFDRCGPEDFMMDLCDYQNKTFSSDKVDDNYHTGEFGAGVHGVHSWG
uniref:Chloride channel protein n=1 Tax=Gongylonema pulchrum TaxID=637853 RepID=A0A183DSD6_9BILA